MALDLGHDADAVVGVESALEQPRVAQPLLGGETEDRLDLRADIERTDPLGTDLVEEDDGRDLLNQGAIARLRVAEPLFRLSAIGDVGHGAAQHHRPAGFVPQRHRVVAEPADPAVALEEPVLERCRLAGLPRARDRGEDAGAVVRVEALAPQLRAREPLHGRVAQEGFELGTHVERADDLVERRQVADRRDLLDEAAVSRPHRGGRLALERGGARRGGAAPLLLDLRAPDVGRHAGPSTSTAAPDPRPAPRITQWYVAARRYERGRETEPRHVAAAGDSAPALAARLAAVGACPAGLRPTFCAVEQSPALGHLSGR